MPATVPAEVLLRLLGPVELLVDGEPRDLGSAKQRCVLAVLLLEPGPVRTETLIDGVWNDDPPDGARAALYSYLARLRKALCGTGIEIRRRSGGYVLDTGAARVDVREIDESTVDLWRGEPLGGLSGAWVERVRTGLRRRRLAVLTEWAGARLASGAAEEVAELLAPEVAVAPTAEPLIAGYLRALHRIGRTGEAVELYRDTVRRLDEELGAVPGPALTEVYREIAAGRGPALLPPSPAGFVGRSRQLAELDQLAGGIVLVTGMAGAGKTALAVTWAHRAAEHFPDGQLYLNLRGYSAAEPVRPLQALTMFLHALGVAPSEIPFDEAAAAALYRSLLATRRMLVLLDNAGSVAQVRPLLPGTDGCVAVITSRQRLPGLIVDEGARAVRLDSLPEPDAVELLANIVGVERISADPTGTAALVAACGRLPLALWIAAANLRDDPALAIAEAVAAHGSDAVRAAFDQSYLRLAEDERRLFRLLSSHPGPDLTAEAAGALAGVPPALARRLLDRLVSAHLVELATHPRYAVHDLLRQYAGERARVETDPTERAAAAHRLGEFYLHSTHRAVRLGAPALAMVPVEVAHGPVAELSEESALGWLDAERTNLVLLCTNASELGMPDLAWQLSGLLRGYFQVRPYNPDWSRVIDAGMAAACRSGDPVAMATAALAKGYLFRMRGPARSAVRTFEEAAAHAERAKWTVGVAAALTQLGLVYPRIGRAEAGVDALERAISLARAEGDPAIEGTAHGNLGSVCADRGLLGRARAHLLAELSLLRLAPSRYRQANAVADLGLVLGQLGEFTAAIEAHREGLRLAEDLGHRSLQAHAEINLAAGYLSLGRLEEAAARARQAIVVAVNLRLRGIQAEALSVLAAVEDAPARHEQAVRAAHESGDSRTLVEVLTRRAERGTRMSDVDAALAVAREHGYRVFEARALCAAAAVHLSDGRVTEAAEFARAALALCRETGHRPGEDRASALLSRMA